MMSPRRESLHQEVRENGGRGEQSVWRVRKGSPEEEAFELSLPQVGSGKNGVYPKYLLK